ncbi:MAG TPA: glycoside hydrolase family 30 beta sandwich domain-containing protein, partial [Mariniflexile sp.]|nr:glycoside hydrolase family 30 beta sandwich domain-containing protein [Mariniflexile sp.]
SPVHGNTQTGELTFTNAYYYIGHFSKFIRPQAKRVSSASSSNNLLTTAFQNTDGSLVIIVMNVSDTEVAYSLNMQSKTAKLHTWPHSIQTIVLK